MVSQSIRHNYKVRAFTTKHCFHIIGAYATSIENLFFIFRLMLGCYTAIPYNRKMQTVLIEIVIHCSLCYATIEAMH